MVSDFFFGFNDNFNGEIIKNHFLSIKCQGRSGNRGREPGHPHELQRGVSPGGRPQHQGAVRIWRELLTVAEQLFLFMLSGCLNWTPTPAFYFWY